MHARTTQRNRAALLLIAVAMVATILAMNVTSAGAAETQRTILDINGLHDHTDYFPTNAQQSNKSILNQPTNYKSPVNYHEGTWYARVDVQSKPSSKKLYTQLCLWQHTPGSRDFKYETCSPRNNLVIVDEGVYYAEIGSPSGWWNIAGGPFNWSKKADMVRFFLKDPVSEKLMYTSRCGSACYPFNDIDKHMPIRMDVEIIMVAKGAKLNQPSNWNCPSSICGSSGGGGGTTTTTKPQSTTTTTKPSTTTTTKPSTTTTTKPSTTTTLPTGGESAAGKTILLTNGGGVAEGDRGIRDALVAWGRQVLVLADTAITSTQADDADVIVISSSVTPGEVPDWLKSVTTPILVNEAYVFDDLGLAGQPGEAPATNSIDVKSGHPIAGSFSGPTTVMSPADKPNTGSPSTAADIIATAGGQPSIFAYDSGDRMASGTAPARRVAFFMSYGAGVDATANAYTLFANAVAWLTGTTPPPTTDDVGVFDPDTGLWALPGENGSTQTFYFGVPGDIPLLGDWDCDGLDTVAMYRPDSSFLLLRNRNDFGVADREFYFGIPGDIPIAGDWDGDGCDTFAMFRPAEGRVYVANSLGTRLADFSFPYGGTGDRPFAGDFNGDGKDTIGFFTATGKIVYRNKLSGGFHAFIADYGQTAHRVVAGDWDGDGDDTPAAYQPDGTVRLWTTWALGTADETLKLVGDRRPVAGITSR